jgi:hypothetical protein
MKKTIKLSESDLHNIVKKTVRRLISEDYKYGQPYVIFDGTSYQAVDGSDIDIDDPDIEVVDGPFMTIDDAFEEADRLNDEAYPKGPRRFY